MSTHETVRLITPGQVKEFGSALLKAIPIDMPAELAQSWIGRKGELAQKLRELLLGDIALDNLTLLERWEKFYASAFNWSVHFKNVVVPARQEGFGRLIVVAEGLTPGEAIRACRNRFPVWSDYDDLDKAVVKNDREPTQPYAVWVRNRVEADEELKNFSASQLQEQGVPGITLLEHFILELKFYVETDDHLNKRTITLCYGSRDSDGDVLSVCWRDGGLSVDRYHPDDRRDDLRSRQVVS